MAASASRDRERRWWGEFNLGEGNNKPGALAYHPTEGITLTLEERVSASEGASALFVGTGLPYYPLISGTLEGDQPITLIDCLTRQFDHKSFVFERRTIAARTAIVGISLADAGHAAFNKLRFGSPNLVSWLGTLGLKPRYRSGARIDYSWSPPKTRSFRIDDERTASWLWGYRNSQSLGEGSINFELSPRLVLAYKRKQPWRTARNDLLLLDAFFSLLARDWNGPPIAELESNSSRRVLDSTTKRRTYFHEPHEALRSDPRHYKRVGERRFPLIRPDEGLVKVPHLLSNWFSQSELVGRLMGLFRAAQRPGIGLEMRYLLLAQSLEHAHREMFGGTLVSEPVFQKVLSDLENALPASLDIESKATLKDRLKYINEPSFPRRLREILRKIEDPVKFLKDPRAFVGECARYRNVLTHHLPLDENWAANVRRLAGTMEVVVELLIWRIAGLETPVPKLLERSWSMRQAIGENRPSNRRH